ncbi:CMRF35-like molecule 5 isoform X4 [Polyodon spathula]|uniref:CMRF35-like molecule 5 isoform X4 n=1 Tax=Polyodon spathula TaxID=7913 RepID=UPI001B7EC3C3|nr:CMRF35-like molecule 5 isoform X4 [Polyodon spathula]
MKKRKDKKKIFFSAIRKLLLSLLARWFSVSEMTLLILLAALSGAEALSGPGQVNGLLRESVTIQCRYGKDYKDSVKYWCKGHTKQLCDTVVKTDDLQTNNRISIRDNKTEGVFTVTMRELREEDEGRYWCAIEQTSFDEGTSVYLTVNKGTFKPTAETPTTTIPRTTERAAPATASTAVNTSSSPGQRGPTAQREGDTSNLTIVLSVVCGCLLLLCMLCLMIRMKINRDKQKGNIMSSTQPSPTYTTVRFQNNAQMPASDDGIYANMNSSQRQTQEPQSSESVEYSVLAF